MLDEQVGRLLDGLQANGFKNNTIVVLISDHGFHLGEKNHVHKNTIWEETTRVPMIWRVPGKSKAFCNTAVDLMSIYPTLKAYCNLNKSLMSVPGKPLNGLIDNPNSGTEGDFALTVAAGDLGGNQNKILAAVQTRDWRLIKYVINSDAANTEELYENSTDVWEEYNLRPNPSTAINDRLTSLRNKISGRMPVTKTAEFRGAIDACQ
jgi:arylsulfatase A-like enzyme